MINKIEHSDLEAIASSIIDRHKKCESLIKSIQAKGREACILAWEIGDSLRDAQNELKGKFTSWRKTALPELGPATTSRYLALVKRIPDRKDLEAKLTDGVTLTQLYRTVGILPKRTKSAKDDPQKSAPATLTDETGEAQDFTPKDFFKSLSTIAKKTVTLREKAPVSHWSETERNDFRKAFNALRAVADELDNWERSKQETIAETVATVVGATKSPPVAV